MILQDDPIPPRIEWFVDTFGGTEGWMLIGCGIMALIWFLYEGYRKGGFIRPKKEEWEYDEVSRTLKVMIYLGIFFGMLVLATAAVGMIYDIPPSSKMDPDFGYDRLTSIVLIILGFFMFIKPVTDIPWASIFGLLAGAGASLAIFLLIPNKEFEVAEEALNVNISLKWILLAVFLIVFALVFTLIKFSIKWAEITSKIMSWPPVALIISILCFVQGIALVGWGYSLSML